MGIFDIPFVDQRCLEQKEQKDVFRVSVFDDFVAELKARRVLNLAIRTERFLPYPPFTSVKDSPVMMVPDITKEVFVEFTRVEAWVRRRSVVFLPGPRILISPLAGQDYARILDSLGFQSLWTSNRGDLEKRLREIDIDVALEWHDEKDSPVLNVVRRLQLQCPVLLCRNRGVEETSEAFRLGYDGLVSLPDGNPAELLETALRAMARWKEARRKHLDCHSLLKS